MAQEVFNCFESYEFFGEFFETESSSAARFAAKIKYSPQDGLQLEYSLANSSIPNNCERLFGILSNGKKCTLVGDFDFDSGTHFMGQVHVRSGVHGFYYLIIGDFVCEEQLFECTHFTFNGMQEFIHPQGWLTQLKYQDSPIVKVSGGDWDIEVINVATYSMVGKRLKNLIGSRDKEAKEKFDIAFDEILESHPKAFFNLRKSLKYYVRYSTKEFKGASDIIGSITRIASLFSILMSRPVFPEEIELTINGKDEAVKILNSMVLEARTVELAQAEISHNFMPLNWKQLDMSMVLSNWFKVYDDFHVLSVAHQYDTGFVTLHHAHSDILLYSTQLEAINIDLGGQSAMKYINPIETYASPELVSQLRKLFEKVGEDNLGKAISTVRNELAHVGRPKVMMKKLSINDYADIGYILRLVVISHLLSRLGVEREQIYQYQHRLSLE
ncbi:HEPN domain-containing protein [Vibrio diabolicus]|uniref:ApeA N-terminal domain 1-containing protein n=1 Tax=Vibrio diabolicus TaxID=50719 RepID=UPI003747C3FA